MSSKGYNTLGLFEFLEEAELQQYYNSLTNVLQVRNAQQLKYVVEEDLLNIGMSKPESRRLKTLYGKTFPSQNYASKLKKLLRPSAARRGHYEANQEFLLASEEDAFAFMRGNSQRLSSNNIRVPTQHIIPMDSITVHKELGAGEFGVVQQGVWTDEDQMRHQVAIKCLAKERMQNNTVEFMKEYDIMQAVDHPNIVRLYGVVLDSSQIMLITELAPLRSLLECLKEPSLRATLTVPCLARFAVQICEGMRYLEDKRFIHRDLAARNILVFSKTVVKVSDFGLSRALGVGKDYYQTNFNPNLKLPIAWCAPECINFLKFTSASDVWAFGVTLWEMFSYGFQPWAAQTGQQILEAIDEPNSQRLDQPVHCPKEHYSILLQTWKHDQMKRPTFAQLVSILEEAKPEQVQAVMNSSIENNFNHQIKDHQMLHFEQGEIITVLDKREEMAQKSGQVLWKGALNSGHVGLFSPSLTVAYIGTLPSSASHSNQHSNRWQTEEIYQSTSAFQRGNSLRGSKGLRRKISRDMISAPQNDFQHTGHIGVDGAFFGDVGFVAGGEVNKQPRHSVNSNGGGQPFISMPSLSRADSDVSEKAPLIANRKSSNGNGHRNGSTGGGTGGVNNEVSATGANKNPRMGYAIGYLRKTGGDSVDGGKFKTPAAPPANDTHRAVNKSEQQTTKHEYQTITDDEFGGPLDLGPSLMDEVFSELDSSRDSQERRKEGEEYDEEEGDSEDDDDDDDDDLKDKKHAKHLGQSMRDVRDLVSSTLKLNKHKQKQQATVKPIKASDEKTLESAIAMANALASKSLHDLDKRHLEDFYDPNRMMMMMPPVSPVTPTSPSKKFSFWFPGKSSPKSERKHFSDEAKNNADIESLLTPGEKDAYKILVEGSTAEEENELNSPKSPSSPQQHQHHHSHHQQHQNHHSQIPSNPLPLPPKSQKLNLSQPPKRHIRKNPLIIPSGTAANLLSKADSRQDYGFQEQPPTVLSSTMPRPPSTATSSSSSSLMTKSLTLGPSSSLRTPSSDTTRQNRLSTGSAFDSDQNDAFENQIASSMDALDNIDEVSKETPSSPPVPMVVSAACNFKSSQPKKRSLDSDEVRIMKKVLGAEMESAKCAAALDATDWNVHHAIKLIKIKNLIKAPGISDAEMKVALQTRDWDVAKAANVLMKKIKE